MKFRFIGSFYEKDRIKYNLLKDTIEIHIPHLLSGYIKILRSRDDKFPSLELLN